MKHQTPNAKHQRNIKLQTSNFTPGSRWGLKFDVWSFFEVWCLKFDASLALGVWCLEF
jgi:hypothetical protein